MKNTTFTWRISNLERQTSDGCVLTAHYTVEACDGTHKAGAYGSVGFEPPEESLIPYEDLTEEMVLGWVKDKLGEESIKNVKAALQRQIDEQKAPSVAGGTPW